jgi:acetolactate synthase I/II/III large subunit
VRVWDAVAEILRREGVEYLFNFPAHPVIDACAVAGIRPVICRQERVGCGMADGYSRITGGRKIGVFAMQAGPGAENAFAGVACAYADSSPVLVLPLGQERAKEQVSPYFTAGDAYAPITKSLETVRMPEHVVDVMRRAFSQLRGGRPGPVMVEIPRDVGEGDVGEAIVEVYRPVVSARSAGDPADVAAAAEALVRATRPLIYAGQGVLYAEAWDELRALAELLAAPVITTIEGIGAFPEDHPLSLGLASITMRGAAPRFIQGADLVFAIGASLTRGDLDVDLPPGKTIVHATGDPNDLNKSYFVDHAILGDAKLVLADLVDACRDLLGGKARPSAEVEAEIHSLNAAWLNAWMPKLTSDEVPLTPYRVIWDFARTVDPAGAIVTHDCGSPRHQLTPFYRTTRPHGYIGWGKSHALGTGIGLIMGAKLAEPGKLCVHFMGDAAFGMTGLDVETAVRAKLPVLFVVLNNSTMANETKSLIASHELYNSRDLGGNYADVAAGLGLAAERVERPEEIVPAFQRARAATEEGQPALLEFVTSAETSLSRDGMVVSQEDAVAARP